MDTPSERTITVWVDGEGKMNWRSEGLSDPELNMIADIIKDDIMDHVKGPERKKPAEQTLLDNLKAIRTHQKAN